MSWSSESSPDPLTRSITNASVTLGIGSSPSKAIAALDARHTPTRDTNCSKSPRLLSASPAKQQQTIFFSTPRKEFGSNTAVQASPWRIKVTLEAEPEDGQKPQSPRRSKTTTVQVPLKDEVRPRKRRRTSDRAVILDATPAVPDRKRRRPTPGRYKDGRKNAVKTVDEAADVSNTLDGVQQAGAEGEEAVAPAPRRRGRPRKSIAASAEVPEPAPKASPAKQDAKSARKAGRRDSRATEAIGHVHTRDVTTPVPKQAATPQQREEDTIVVEPPYSHNIEEDVSVQGRGTKSIKGRIHTPRRPAGFDESLLSSLPPSSARSVQGNITHDAEASEDDDDPAEDDTQDGCVADEPEDDETAMLDRSLAESEGFTMVSIESLRSHAQQFGSKAPLDVHWPSTTFTNTAAASGATARNASSPQHPASQNRKPHPSAFSGTSSAGGVQVHMSSTSSLASNSQTDNALTSNMDVHHAHSKSAEQPMATELTSVSNDDPFDAFRTGTRRQLRAGLAMGELLARSEPGFSAATKQVQPAQSRSSPRATTRANLGLDHTGRLPTPADTTETSSSPAHDELLGTRAQANTQNASKKDYDDMSWEPTTFVEERAASARRNVDVTHEPIVKSQVRSAGHRNYDETTHATATVSPHGSEGNKTTKDREVGSEEVEDGTIRRHKARPTDKSSKASSSARPRVAGDDIWLEEAESLLDDSMIDQAARAKRAKPTHGIQHDIVGERAPFRPQAPSQDLRDILGEPDDRPARGKIPRTWRRTSGSHFLYSDENPSPVHKTAGPATPLFMRDLRALQEESEEGEERDHESESEEQDVEESIHIVSSIERSPSPLKSILSSPHRPRDRRSPSREVRWGQDDIREFEDRVHNQCDERYFSSDDDEELDNAEDDDVASEHSETYCDADATIYNIDTSMTSTNDGSTALQTSDVRQLRQELAAVSPRKQNNKRSVATAQLDTDENAHHNNKLLRPDSSKQYAPLFGPQNTFSSKEPPTPRRKPLPPTPRRPTPPSKPAREPTRGMFSRLSGWLYPPPPSEPTHGTSATLAQTATGKSQVNIAGKSIEPSTRSQSDTNINAAFTHTKAPGPVLPKLKATTPSKLPTRSGRTDSPRASSSAGHGSAERSRHPKDTSPSKLTTPSTLRNTPKPSSTTTTPAPTPAMKPGWNRNHYLILQTHYRATFPTPASVIAAAKALHCTTSNHVASPTFTPQDEEIIASLPPTLIALLHKSVISTQSSTPGPSQPSMYITPSICAIVVSFTREISDRGVPLLSDGSLSPPSAGKLKEMGFPVRGRDGRVVRKKEKWDEWTVLTKVYGFWVQDLRAVGEEVGEVKWPAVAVAVHASGKRE